MRGLSTLILAQALLSTIAGVLMSNMSWIGKVSIWAVYTDYGMLKVWWKAALLVFAVQLVFVFLLWLIRQVVSSGASRFAAFLVIAVAAVGAYFTWIEFTTTSYRMMKAQFHSGGYFFWIALAVTGSFFLVYPKKRKSPVAASENTTDLSGSSHGNISSFGQNDLPSTDGSDNRPYFEEKLD